MISLERRIALLLGIILFVSYAYFFQGGGWNPNSRLDLTRALAEQHTLAIDDYVGNTGDWAYFNGHYYANKAPGLSLLAVPVWIATDILLPSTTTLDARAWWTNVFVNALPASLLGVCLFVTLGWLGVSSIHARVGATLAYGLGTLAFPYATAFYAHQPAAVFGFASFAALVRAKQTDDKYAWALGAGALAGMSVLMEMSCLIIPVVLGLWLAIGRDARRLGFFILGGIPLAAVLMLYGWMAFHDPLARWTRWANPNVEVRVNGNLFGWPSPTRIYGLLLSGYRGLLFTSPVLILAAVGWPALRRARPAAAFVCAGIVLAFVLLIASFYAWHGGWAPGPRYLVPCLPFAAVPMAFAFERLRLIATTLAAFSVLFMTAITVVAIEIPMQSPVPLRHFVAHYLREGRVSVNPHGINEFLPAADYFTMHLPQNNHSSNLGEFLFPGRVESVVPLLLFWALLGFMLLRALSLRSKT